MASMYKSLMGGLYHEAKETTSLNIQLHEQMERALAYAEACFETFRIVDDKVFRFDAHMDRLRHGLAAFGLELSKAYEQAIWRACIQRAAAVGRDVLLRLTVGGGVAPWGLRQRPSSLAVHIQAMKGRQQKGEAWGVMHEWPFPPRWKEAKFVADYAETLRALQDVDPGQHVLFLHGQRLLTAETANVLIWRHETWWTPKLEPGVLPGIVRGFLLQQGLLREADCSKAWLWDCEAVVLCNSGFFLRPLAGIDGRKLNAKHPAIELLAQALRDEPGVPSWL